MNSVAARLTGRLRRRPCTLLGIGPMSRLCVDAAVDLANRHAVDLMLIASRRQIDSDRLGAGYVEGWNADRFGQYVRSRDAGGHILLCRDHGGPWQNGEEVRRGFSMNIALDSARASYEEDIAAGFAVIHIDPSVGPAAASTPSLDMVMDNLYNLYRFCWDTARHLGREIVFEIGTEEQSSVSHSLQDFAQLLARVEEFCQSEGFPRPFFLVAQTGTKVMETRNVGSLNSPYRVEEEIPAAVHLPQLVALLNRFGYRLKQHNTDYLSDEVLRWHPWFGIHAANVAPEFGVVETRTLLHVLESRQLNDLRDRFLEVAYATRKWEKWMLPDTTAGDRDRAVIAGHYTFSMPEVQEIKASAQRRLDGTNIEIDQVLKTQVEASILRYLTAFRLVDVA